MATDLEGMQKEIDEAIAFLRDDSEIRHKAMFGGVCSYANERVFASLSNVGLGLKLSPEDRDELLKIDGAKPVQYEPNSAPSKSYFVVPESVRKSPDAFAYWVGKSLEFVSTLLVPKKKSKS